jgi:formylglycine-generating enzyme required for sulfatase activity
VALAVSLAVGARWLAQYRDRSQRLARGEIEVRVTGAWPVSLYRAGRTLDEAEPLELPPPGRLWVPAANHFVGVEQAGVHLWFPVPLAGQMRGPDADGSFAVTVRSAPLEWPPVADPGLSRWVIVPGGWAAIGNTLNPGESHFVYLPTFFVGAFEVTNGEFRRFLADPDGYEARENWTAAGWQWRETGLSQVTARLTPADANYARFGQADHPVVLVTWHEANAYARWLTRRLGGGVWVFRLATDAEWEKAARGPDGFDYGLGMSLSEPEAALYNWRKNPEAEVTVVGVAETMARYRPNRYGVYHASGNVAEWSQSVARPHNRKRPYRDDDRNRDDTPGTRSTRGGSWYSASAARLHLAYREEFQPELSSNDLGFRLVAVRLPVRTPREQVVTSGVVPP